MRVAGVMGEHHGDGEFPARVGEAGFVRRVFDQLPLLVLGLTGPELRVGAATAAYRTYTGRQDLVGRSLSESFPEVLGQQVLQIFERVYASGRSESLHEFRFQMERPDTGEQVETFLDFTADPLWGPDGTVIGVITHGMDVTARVRERRAVQERAAEAERRYAQARDVIDALQRELLPSGVPVLPGVQLAASYLLADADTAAGGDWFDVVVLPGGRVAMVVGDVVGHGVTASATMGQLRILLHEQLVTNPDLVAVMTAVDASAARIRGARAATVCVLILDPVSGAVEYCTAGHPPPLVLSGNGGGRYLAPSGAGPIGVGGAFSGAVLSADRLIEGDTVLLYTDGIVERPGRELARSTVELAQAAADVATGSALRDEADSVAGRVATQTLELLVRVTGHSDDITLLAGQLVAPPAALEMTVAADQEALNLVRQRLDDWLVAARVAPHDAAALRHAVVELVTNVIDHAFIDSPDVHDCEVTVTLLADGRLRARVADRGHWRRPVPSADRGLGLHLTDNLVDALTITHDEHGTTAVVEQRAEAPARLLTADDLTWRPVRGSGGQLAPLRVLDRPAAPRPRIQVDGPIDASTAAELERAVGLAGVTGTRSLIVDLSGVTHLASVGVAALHRFRASHRGNGTVLRLYAPAGTPADMILSLVQVPHDVRDPDEPVS